MKSVKLTARKRETASKGDLHALRKAGRIPGVIYGKDREPVQVSFDEVELRQVLAGGPSGLLQVRFDEAGERRRKHFAVISEVQRHPTKPMILHVDLHEVDLAHEIEAQVPIELEGQAKGQEVGGIVEQLLREVHVKALPERIPSVLHVDVSPLGIGDHVVVGDLPPSDEYQVLSDPAEIVVTVLPPRLAREFAAAEEAEASAAEASSL